MRIRVILSIIALIGSITGGGFTLYSTFASNVEFQEHRQEYLEDKLTLRRNRIEDRIWKYEDRYGSGLLSNPTVDPLTRDTYRELKRELKDISDVLKLKYKQK